MDNRTRPSAAPALVILVLAFLLGGSTPATARRFMRSLAISPDGRRLYQTNYPRVGVSVIDTTTNRFLTVLPVPVQRGENLGPLAVSPDGRLLYMSTDQEPPVGGNILVVDLTTGSVVASIPTERRPGTVLVSRDGSRLYVLGWLRGYLQVIDTAAARVIATIPFDFWPRDAALTPDGRKLYVTIARPRSSPSSENLQGRVVVIETATNRIKTAVPVHPGPAAVAVSPDGRRVYVTHGPYDASMVDVIATDSDELVELPGPMPGGLSLMLAVSPDGQRLYVLPYPWNIASAIDPRTREVLGVADIRHEPSDMVMSPDGRRLYVSHAGPLNPPPGGPLPRHTITVLDAPTLQVIATIILPKSSQQPD